MNAAAQKVIEWLPIDRIEISDTESQLERRRHFDPAGINELARSLEEIGLLSPIIVRKVPAAAGDNYQLVAGERRLLAAKKVNWKEINCAVLELTNEQVLEIQLVENLQREDLHELAEAEGYEALLKLGRSAEEIAHKTAKSKAYVYARMKLLALSKAARRAFYDGKLSASTALLLARIPVESLQNQALKDITEEDTWDGPMSFRVASDHIQREYMTRLADAGFPTEDKTLVPAAGPCSACPKRTGNQRELFSDVKAADVCTDPVCFKSKREAFSARVLAHAKASGRKVITGPAAKKIIPHGAHHVTGGYVSLTAKCYDDRKNRTYGQILGKAFEPELVQDPVSGVILEVAPESAARKAAGLRSQSSSSGTQSQAEKKAKRERAIRQEIFSQVRHKYPDNLARSDFDDLAIAMVHEMHGETCKQLFALWGWKPAKEQYGSSYRKAAAELVPKLPPAQLQKFLFDLILVSDMQVSTWSDAKPKKLLAAAERFKVDVEKIRREALAAAKPKSKAKGKHK